jgi:hypothetical protein
MRLVRPVDASRVCYNLVPVSSVDVAKILGKRQSLQDCPPGDIGLHSNACGLKDSDDEQRQSFSLRAA